MTSTEGMRHCHDCGTSVWTSSVDPVFYCMTCRKLGRDAITKDEVLDVAELLASGEWTIGGLA